MELHVEKEIMISALIDKETPFFGISEIILVPDKWTKYKTLDI